MYGKSNRQYASPFGQTSKTFEQQNSIGNLLNSSPFCKNKNCFDLKTKNNSLVESQTQGSSTKYKAATKKRGHSPLTGRFNCISCMDAYKDKSLEELLWEDIQLNQKESLQNKNTSSLTEQSLFLNKQNILDKPAFTPMPKPSNDFTGSIEPRFLVEPLQVSNRKSVHNFNLTSNLSTPTSQTNYFKKSNDTFNLNPALQHSCLQEIGQNIPKPAVSVACQLNVPAFSDVPVNENINFLRFTNSQAGDTFYSHLQNIFQPFPRRDNLTSIGSNFNMQNRPTDPKEIGKILEKLRASDHSKTKASNYARPYFNGIKRSFFDDVGTHVSMTRRIRSLELTKSFTENESGTLQNVQTKTPNLNCNTEEMNLVTATNCYLSNRKLKRSLEHIKNCTIDNKPRRCLELKSNHVVTLSPGSSKTTQTNRAEIGVQVCQEEPQVGDCQSTKPNVKLTKYDYYTTPPIDELYRHMNGDHACVLDNFIIGRKGFGKVRFLDLVNLTNLDFDEIIDIGYRYVAVYPDDKNKPPVGQGLNVKAEITIDQIWPLDKSSNTRITEAEKVMDTNFIDKLKKLSEKQNSSFVNYLPDTGSWIFNVDHF